MAGVSMDNSRHPLVHNHYWHTGNGFSPVALKRATEQFYMDDQSRNAKSHYGIGLYVANSIITQHGGQLLLSNSEKGGGAQVAVKIPY